MSVCAAVRKRSIWCIGRRLTRFNFMHGKEGSELQHNLVWRFAFLIGIRF